MRQQWRTGWPAQYLRAVPYVDLNLLMHWLAIVVCRGWDIGTWHRGSGHIERCWIRAVLGGLCLKDNKVVTHLVLESSTASLNLKLWSCSAVCLEVGGLTTTSPVCRLQHVPRNVPVVKYHTFL